MRGLMKLWEPMMRTRHLVLLRWKKEGGGGWGEARSRERGDKRYLLQCCCC